jgi:hypothetical protein
MVFPVLSVRPEEIVIRATSERVFPKPTILFKAIDRPRIRIGGRRSLELPPLYQATAMVILVGGSCEGHLRWSAQHGSARDFKL